MKRRLIRIGVVVGLVAPMVVSNEASAAKGRVPGKPIIVKMVATRQTKNLSKMTITIELPPSNGSPILDTTLVSEGGSRCTIKGNKRSCTLYRVNNRLGFAWTAQSRNKFGKGPVSARVQLTPSYGRWLRSGYTPAGVRYPARVTRTTGSRVLQQGPGVQKWLKFQAIKQTGITAASVRTASLPQVNPSLITFQTAGVVGLALPPSNSTGSGLLAVNRDGTVVDAVQTGTANIRDFYAAPNNKFYVVFSGARPLYTGGPNCLLAEVDADSGNPVCVDSQVASVTTSFGTSGPYGMTSGNSPIQFDNAGNVYYVGLIASSGAGPVVWALRKSVNGVVTNLVSDFVSIRDFVVLPDGTVVMSGTTTSTQTSWVRKVSPSGALTNLSATSASTFLRKFADGNVYMGFNGNSTGVKRYLASTGALDPKWWISQFDFEASHFVTSSICQGNTAWRLYPGFCSTQASFMSASFNLGSSTTFVVAGMRGGQGTTLMQYYPTVDPVLTSVRNVTLAQMVGRKLVLVGTTAESVNTLAVLDLDTYQETVLIDATNEIEIYNMSYIAATNKIMFNGLRFADNTFVVGEVDMP